MSGHSKWSTIKRKKGAIDAARSKVFQKLAKELYVAAKSGDADPNNNASLKYLSLFLSIFTFNKYLSRNKVIYHYYPC